MNEFMLRKGLGLWGTLSLALCGACGLEGLEAPSPEGPHEEAPAAAEELGLIELALETVPADVACMRVKAKRT